MLRRVALVAVHVLACLVQNKHVWTRGHTMIMSIVVLSLLSIVIPLNPSMEARGRSCRGVRHMVLHAGRHLTSGVNRLTRQR